LGHILFHLPGSWLRPLGEGVLPFYQRLFDGLDERGIAWDTCILDREKVMDQVEADDAFHIINHGRFQHPRVLNSGIAYVYPFWNMDPAGIRAFSSIANSRFQANEVDGETARPFFRRLRQRLAIGRTSRYEQPDEIVDVPTGSVAVFLQSEGHRIVGETCYLDRWQMVEGVLAAVDGPVVVKPHPRDHDPETTKRLEQLCNEHSNLAISEANIHDILSAADRVVTINSAVGVEAYLHRKPVILCGKSDFHHIAQVAKNAQELGRFLKQEKRAKAYYKYVYRYFAQQCLNTVEPDLIDRFLQRVTAQGYAV
jgi:hypothetical protein